MSIAGVVIARNEEQRIAQCLKSLSFCDEIIVIDSGSDDRTVAIAKQITPLVHFRAWTGYADQKNHAVSLAKSDWILSLDADEECSAELQQEILKVISADPVDAAFLIPRKTMHSGRWIRHGGWYPNRLIRLFKKGTGTWLGNEVHERWESTGSVGRLESDIIHYSFDSISDQVRRNDEYSSLGARQLQRSGKKFGWTKIIFKPMSKFLETYLIKFGFLDGFPGLIISVSAAYSVFLKWAKLWEIEKSVYQNGK